MTAGPISLDLSRQEVKVNDAVIELTSYEYKIIEYLIVRAGQVISKTELTERLYDQDFERDSNVIEVFVGRLRKKLDPDNTIQPIETLRGRGYRFGLERNQSA
jgi:two-component system response regulator PhoP